MELASCPLIRVSCSQLPNRSSEAISSLPSETMNVHLSLGTAQLCHAPVHSKNFLPSLLKRNACCRKPGRPLVLHASAAGKSSSHIGGFDLRNLERAMKLHSAIRNRSIKEFMELISDEWNCYTTSLSLHPWQLSKKAFQMLYHFLVRNGVMVIIKPTADYGVDIGIRVVSHFAKENLPLGFACSISTSHFYEGMVFFRNWKNIIDLLIQMQPAERLEKILFPMIDKFVPKGILEEKQRVALVYSLLSLLIMVVFIIIFKNTMV